MTVWFVMHSGTFVLGALTDGTKSPVSSTRPDETWFPHFPRTRPTLSIIPCIAHGLASYDGTIGINVLAAKPGSAAQKGAKHFPPSTACECKRRR
jgi:hypothetical protein